MAWATSNYPVHQERESAPPTSREINLGMTERVLTSAAGAGLMLAGLRGGPLRKVLAGLTGAALIRRGMTGHCELYSMLGINTAEKRRSAQAGVAAREGQKIERQIRIDAYPAEVYRFWKNLENLPRFFRHLESVQPLGEQRSLWRAKAILGSVVEWEAEIINERENELIAWESLPGSEVDTAGAVRFERSPDGQGTMVQVSLKYNPAGGKLGIALAELFGEGADAKIEEDLQLLKQILERGDAAAPRLPGGLSEPTVS